MTGTRRLQLSRRRGYRKPADAVVVARPGRWGNLWRVDTRWENGRIWVTRTDRGDVIPVDVVESMDEGRRVAVEYFEDALFGGKLLYGVAEVRAELAYCDLACWCPLGAWCHADVLLAAAAGEKP